MVVSLRILQQSWIVIPRTYYKHVWQLINDNYLSINKILLGFNNGFLLITVFVLSMHCKGTIDSTCSQTLYGVTEEILLRNAKYHALNTHSYTEDSWCDLISKRLENIRQLISKIQMAPYDSYYNQQ